MLSTPKLTRCKLETLVFFARHHPRALSPPFQSDPGFDLHRTTAVHAMEGSRFVQLVRISGQHGLLRDLVREHEFRNGMQQGRSLFDRGQKPGFCLSVVDGPVDDLRNRRGSPGDDRVDLLRDLLCGLRPGTNNIRCVFLLLLNTIHEDDVMSG